MLLPLGGSVSLGMNIFLKIARIVDLILKVQSSYTMFVLDKLPLENQ